MDTTDPTISFDADGVCNHCHHFDTVAKTLWFPNETGAKKLSQIVEKIKAEGKDREYDCILGLSGGVDSSYLALVSKEYGLRPLVVHVDAGWNSELAVHNIEQIVKYCDYDLHTHVMEWEVWIWSSHIIPLSSHLHHRMHGSLKECNDHHTARAHACILHLNCTSS